MLNNTEYLTNIVPNNYRSKQKLKLSSSRQNEPCLGSNATSQSGGRGSSKKLLIQSQKIMTDVVQDHLDNLDAEIEKLESPKDATQKAISFKEDLQ